MSPTNLLLHHAKTILQTQKINTRKSSDNNTNFYDHHYILHCEYISMSVKPKNSLTVLTSYCNFLREHRRRWVRTLCYRRSYTGVPAHTKLFTIQWNLILIMFTYEELRSCDRIFQVEKMKLWRGRPPLWLKLQSTSCSLQLGIFSQAGSIGIYSFNTLDFLTLETSED